MWEYGVHMCVYVVFFYLVHSQLARGSFRLSMAKFAHDGQCCSFAGNILKGTHNVIYC